MTDWDHRVAAQVEREGQIPVSFVQKNHHVPVHQTQCGWAVGHLDIDRGDSVSRCPLERLGIYTHSLP